MCGICSEEEPSHSHLLGAPLVDLVRADVGNLVLVWFRMSGEHGFILPRLTLEIFFSSEPGYFSVRDPPESVCADPGSHEPVFRMDDEVCIVPAKLMKVVIYLTTRIRVSQRQ